MKNFVSSEFFAIILGLKIMLEVKIIAEIY